MENMKFIFYMAVLINFACRAELYSEQRHETKIVGGTQISIEDAPHHVSVQYNGAHFCGGSIVIR